MRFEVEMNAAVVKARGTVFQCDALANDHAYVLVYDGAVEVSMGEHLANLQAGQALDIWLGQPLEPVNTGQAIPGGPPESTALPVSTATFTEREKTAFPPVSTPTRPGDLIATPEGGLVYTVESGDTLYSIARKFGVSWEAIWNANKDILPRPEFVRAGQQLRIPSQ
ncbi:MAG: LysM peptidoglycan-binding domain-containing protein [Chloroflexi bacterium]|nr:LysM peptidoglycan-binding domain-containing protein [Chloroflexota bacterium]